jgi:hypothetical protein
MRLFVGKRPIRLPGRRCDAADVCREVSRANPPFFVSPTDGRPFTVKRRVFLEAEGLRVECEDEGELRLACKLSAEAHNLWQTQDETLDVIRDTERAERAIAEAQADEEEMETGAPNEEDDITLEEWSQLGYKWFKKDEMIYF